METQEVENSHISNEYLFNVFTSEAILAPRFYPHWIIWISDTDTGLFPLVKRAVSYLPESWRVLISLNFYFLKVKSGQLNKLIIATFGCRLI